MPPPRRSREEGTFSDLARRLPEEVLLRAYQAIETLIAKVPQLLITV